MGRTTSRKVESLCLHYYQHQLFIDCLLWMMSTVLDSPAQCTCRLWWKDRHVFRILLSERWQADIQTPHPLLCSFSFYYPAGLQKYLLLLLTSSQGTAVGLHSLVFMLWLWLVPQPAPTPLLKHWWSKPWKKHEVWMYPLKKRNKHLFSLYK